MPRFGTPSARRPFASTIQKTRSLQNIGLTTALLPFAQPSGKKIIETGQHQDTRRGFAPKIDGACKENAGRLQAPEATSR
jgi:hypothetical protein